MMKVAFLTVALASVCAFTSPYDSPHKEAFKKFSSLVGTWEGEAGKTGDGMEAKVSYKMTAGGTVVMETFFEGTKNETVSMFHLDSNTFIGTQYGVGGNQPRFVLKPGTDKNDLTLDYKSATNLIATDPHVHSLHYKFVDADHIVVDWKTYVNNKPAAVGHFELHRIK